MSIWHFSNERMLTFCDCGCPSFQHVFGCEVQPDLPPGHSDHEKGPVPAGGEDAEVREELADDARYSSRFVFRFSCLVFRVS